MSMWSSIERTRRRPDEADGAVPTEASGTVHAAVRRHWRVAQRSSVWQQLRRQGIKAVLARALNLRVIVSVVFGVGLLAAVLALGNPARAWHLMVQTGWQTVVGVVLLTIPYWRLACSCGASCWPTRASR